MSFLNQITIDQLADKLVSSVCEAVLPKIHDELANKVLSAICEVVLPKISDELAGKMVGTVCETEPPKISYSIPEFCEKTSLGRSTVYEMLASKQLPARKCGSRTIITHADAISFIQSLPIVGEDS